MLIAPFGKLKKLSGSTNTYVNDVIPSNREQTVSNSMRITVEKKTLLSCWRNERMHVAAVSL